MTTSKPDNSAKPDAKAKRSAGRVNLNDIAQRVGVSPITVSRALRTPDLVSPATRAKIQAAVEELGYVPDLVAASLASRHSKVVAVILPTITQALFADTIQGLVDVLRLEGYQLIVGDNGYSSEIEASLISTLLGRRPDGLVLVGGEHLPPTRRLLANAGVPVVEIWELPEKPIDSVVGFSNFNAMYAMTHYLLKTGRRRIAFISTRRNPRALARQEGYIACLREHGQGQPPLIALPATVSDLTDPAMEFIKLVHAHPDIDAVCCADDIIAFNVVFACQRQGWPVPDRFAISGFCDLDMARKLYPALTTVRIPGYDMGREAGRLVLGRLHGDISEPVTLDLGFEIIQRETA